MQFLCELAGNPERCAPSIHIAGSKGKGSVTGMLSAMLTAAGFSVARYMSPHVVDIRERICLGDQYFEETVYRDAGNELRELVEERLPAACNPLFDETTDDGCEPTYFELLTLFFFLCARKANCNAMVVETGMGGRLDCTNVLDPLVSVITLIELEHTSFLGDTIAQVAEEKAGIIKQGKPLVLAKQCEKALQVFKTVVGEKNSELLYLPTIAILSDVKISKAGTVFNLEEGRGTRDEGQGIFAREPSIDYKQQPPVPCSLSPVPNFSIPIPGKVQAENAALAILAIKTAFPQISEDSIRQGLANLKIPARFEKIANAPPFIIDGAHTPESLELCIETFCSLYGEGGVLLFGCAADKDASAMARIACKRFAKIIITTPGAFKVSNPQKVYEAFCECAKESNQKFETTLVLDTKEAVQEALNYSRSSLPILSTGSFYLVSEVRKIML